MNLQLPPDAQLIIRTRRLELRPIVAGDAAELFPVLADDALHTFTGDAPPESEASLRELYAFRETRRSPDGDELWLNWAARLGETGKAVGFTQATVAARQTDVAWVIGSRWQRQGFASEAAIGMIGRLRALGVTRFRASVHPGHEASRGVAIRAGLRNTGALIDGEEVWTLDTG